MLIFTIKSRTDEKLLFLSVLLLNIIDRASKNMLSLLNLFNMIIQIDERKLFRGNIMEKELFILLDNQNQKTLELLEILSENYKWYTIEELSTELNVVSRTIQRYIQSLKEKINDYNLAYNSTIQLNCQKSNGVRIEPTFDNNYSQFKNYVLKNDETIKILIQIMLEEFQSVKKYSITNYMSENAIRSRLTKIKNFLSRFNLNLSRNNLYISGKEKYIRIFFYIINWTIFKYDSWPFNTVDQNKIYRLEDELSKALGLTFSDIQRKQIAYILAINLVRFKVKHFVEYEPEWKNYVNVTQMLEDIPSLKIFIKEQNIYVESEICFYALLAQMKSKIYESPTLKNNIFAYHKKSNSDVYFATKKSMENFDKNIINIPKHLKENFFIFSFSSNLFCKIFKNITVDIDGHSILEECDYNYPELKNKLLLFIDNLYEQTSNDLFKQRYFLLQKYMLLFSSIAPLNYYEPAINIILESDLPFFIRENIIMRITDHFKYKFNLVFLDTNFLEKSDIVITNIPNIIKEKRNFNYKVHLLSFPIKPRDFFELEIKFMNKLLQV